MPASFAYSPHSHGKAQRLTVMSGILLVGLGSTVVPGKMKAMPAGSFVVMPAGLVHYARARDATILQIDGDGPATTHMLGHKM